MKEYEANAESDEDYDKLKSLMDNGKSEIDGTKATLLSNEAKLTRIKEMCNDEQVSSGTLISMLDSVSYSGGAGNNGAGNKKVKNE